MSVALNEVLTISPAGRASREAYWLSLFAAFALMGASFVVFGFSPAAASFMGFEAAPVAEPVGIALSFLGGVLLLLSVALLATAVVRRLHDLATSGWAALFLLIPVVNVLVLIALGLVRGTSMNRFGPDPLTIPTLDREAFRKAEQIGERMREETVEASSSPESLEPSLQSSKGAETPAASVSPAERLYEIARLQCMDENTSIRLQVKVGTVEKLRKLLKKGRITEAEFRTWKLRIMSL